MYVMFVATAANSHPNWKYPTAIPLSEYNGKLVDSAEENTVY